jgi:hypothetical protein
MDENWQLFEAGVEIIVTMIAGKLLFAWDEKRMTEAQRERAWPDASRGMVECSPLWFFPLWLVGIPLHFLRTRRSVRGLCEAIVATMAMFVLLMAIGTVFELIAGRNG